MELRVLQYFLAVCGEQNILGAAESLHISQPTLSRQLKDLEEELGKQLFIRGNRKITLTEEGMILRKRAEEIIDLVHKTEQEIVVNDDEISGDITIGAGETDTIRYLAKAAQEIQKEHHHIHFHIISGDSTDVMEKLDKGLIDFGLIFYPSHLKTYEHILIPVKDTWGILVRKDHPLAQKESIKKEDLYDQPLILSRQVIQQNVLKNWFLKEYSELNVVGTYSLIYNASLMVEENMGIAITLDKLINTSGNSPLTFIPLEPHIDASLTIIWKKYQILTKPTQLFIEKISQIVHKSQAESQ